MLPLLFVVVLAMLPASNSYTKQEYLQLKVDSAGSDVADLTSSQLLERKLCNSSTNLNDTVVNLDPSRSHTFNGSHNCIIKNVHNFSLTSSNNSETATIICEGSVGFLFVNSGNIVISNIAFVNCGGRLDDVAIAATNMGDPVSSVKRSKVFNNNTYATLLFTECRNMILHMVSVLQYRGFGILAINIENLIEFDHLVISESSDNTVLEHGLDNKVSSNTGVVLFFDKCNAYNSTNITISNSVFSFNNPMLSDTHDNGDAKSAATMQKATSGLTTIMAEEKACLSVKLFVYNTRFERNFGISTSVYVNGGKFSFVFKQCSFRNNTGLGVSIAINGVSNHINLSFSDCLFKNNSNIDKGGALSITIQDSESSDIQLSNYSCELNTAGLNGDCAYIHCIGEHCMNSVKVSLNNVSAYSNGNYYSFPKGLFAFQRVIVYLNCMSINGCVFKGNIGSALFGYHSDIYLRGNASFINNRAFSGSALYFINSFVNFNMEQLPNFLFFDNTADTVGGAIYIVHETTAKLCSLQFNFEREFHFTSKAQNLSTILYFEGNDALLEANTIFAYPAYDCNQLKSSNFIIDSIQLPLFYSEVFEMPSNDSVLSKPDTVRVCGDVRDEKISTFPGRPFQLELILLDGNNNSVYGDVYLIFNTSWTIQHNQYVQQILPGKCNIIRLTILSYETRVYGSLMIQVKDNKVNTKVQIFMNDCPYGLIKVNNTCMCHPLLTKYKAKCDIEAGLISAPFDTWFGLTNDKQLIASAACPIDYCDYYTTNSDSTKSVIPLSELSPCVGHREGIVCGKCKPGYSNVFGVATCHICSNYSIFIVVGYSLAGIALIIALFKLQISISTGWFNAMIFYCNVVSLTFGMSNINDVQVHAKPLVMWLNLLNLELSFPLCLYHLMNETAKGLLQFAFPAYLILLVVGFIILSRYSTRVSRMTSHYSVQVLATLIFLSYTNIVINAAIILQYVKIETENGTIMYMWYQDANVRYFKDIGHCILGVIALGILLFMVIPYTIMLTFSPFMYRYRWVNRVRPFLDAHYGLYKDRYQWWFGLRLWMIFFMAILSTTSFHHHNIYYGLVMITLIFLFTSAQAYLKPYKNKHVNMIEIAVMANLIIGGMAVLTSYKGGLPLKSRPLSHKAILEALLAILFGLFWAIVVWHIYKACQIKNLFKRKVMMMFSQAATSGKGSSTDDDTAKHISSNREHSAFKDYGSCGYREPLLSDSLN